MNSLPKHPPLAASAAEYRRERERKEIAQQARLPSAMPATSQSEMVAQRDDGNREPVNHSDVGPRHNSYGAFAMTVSGLRKKVTRVQAGERKEGDEYVSGPFEILGKSRNPNGGDWGLCLRWRDLDGRLHQRLVPSAALHGEPAALCQILASEGLHIKRKKQRDLADYLDGADVSGRVTRVERTGWQRIGGHEVFVLPSEVIGPSGVEAVILDGAASAPYEASGSLEDWRNGVGALASGHIVAVLAISAALAGPLLHQAGGEGGGIYFFGQSSKGKTTVLQAAASVWGRGASPG